MILLIILGILIVLLIYLLLIPLYVFISTPESRYEAGLGRILKIWITADPEYLLKVWIKIFFYRMEIKPFEFKERKVKAPTKKESQKKKRKLTFKRIKLILRLLWKVVSSFKLLQLKLNIDTGDVIHNAHLVPVFSMVYGENIQLTINFDDKNEFILHFENNIGTILFQIITTFIKHRIKNIKNGL